MNADVVFGIVVASAGLIGVGSWIHDGGFWSVGLPATICVVAGTYLVIRHWRKGTS